MYYRRMVRWANGPVVRELLAAQVVVTGLRVVGVIGYPWDTLLVPIALTWVVLGVIWVVEAVDRWWALRTLKKSVASGLVSVNEARALLAAHLGVDDAMRHAQGKTLRMGPELEAVFYPETGEPIRMPVDTSTAKPTTDDMTKFRMDSAEYYARFPAAGPGPTSAAPPRGTLVMNEPAECFPFEVPDLVTERGLPSEEEMRAVGEAVASAMQMPARLVAPDGSGRFSAMPEIEDAEDRSYEEYCARKAAAMHGSRPNGGLVPAGTLIAELAAGVEKDPEAITYAAEIREAK